MPLAADIAPDLPKWHLAIGECIVTQRPALINTVLGSCVSATFHHPRTGMAGIYHAMLPENGRNLADPRPCKFVTTATRRIMARFQEQRIPPDEITVKLFGGAYSMGNAVSSATRTLLDVGAQNVAMAERELDFFGLRIASRDTHGVQGRKLFFDTATGDVWLRPLSRVCPEALRQAIAQTVEPVLLHDPQSTFVIK